jgi:hypothetical protein
MKFRTVMIFSLIAFAPCQNAFAFNIFTEILQRFGQMQPQQNMACYTGSKPKPKYTSCAQNMYCDGQGTCCTSIQTYPPSCQPPPIK